MPVFPDSRYDNVTNDPETQYTGPLKRAFPGSRPGTVSRDPLREGDTNSAKPPFPNGRPTVTNDLHRDGNPTQTRNANLGGEFGESGVSGALSQGAKDPEHDTAGDGTNPGAAKPAAPTSIVATAGNGQVSVAFTPGARGKSFTATVSPGGATAQGTSSPIVVTGLTNLTAYTVKVTPTNEHGDGPASAASSSFTPTDPAAPTAPTAVTGTAGAGQVSVAFTPGSVAGTTYTVTVNPGNHTATGSASPIVVTGLTAGQASTATVVAHKANHADSPASAASGSFSAT